MIALILKNNFSFNSLLLGGVNRDCIATCFVTGSPSYYLEAWNSDEDLDGPILCQHLHGQSRTWPLTTSVKKPIIWWRCRGDIFAGRPHGKENLMIFLNEINSFHPMIKFTTEGSWEPITFLDTKVVHNGDCLVTDLYTKPTGTHNYLHCCSCHPSHYKKSTGFSGFRGFVPDLLTKNIMWRNWRHTRSNGVTTGKKYKIKINKATTSKREELLTLWGNQIKQVIPSVVNFIPTFLSNYTFSMTINASSTHTCTHQWKECYQAPCTPCHVSLPALS